MVLYKRVHEGGFRAHTLGGGGAGALRNLFALLVLLTCIKELNRPARAAPPITKLIRNQEETVRYIICTSGAKKGYPDCAKLCLLGVLYFKKFDLIGCSSRKENLGAQILITKHGMYSGGDIQLIYKVVLGCSSNIIFSLVLGFPAGRPIPT